MAYTYREAIKTAFNYLNIDNEKVKIIDDTNGRGIVYPFEGKDTVIFIYPISCKQNNRQNFFDTRDSGAKERAVAWKYAYDRGLRYFCLGFNEEQERYKDYVLSLESDEIAISNISFRKSASAETVTGTQVNIPNDFIPSEKFERIRTAKGFYISAIKKEFVGEYLTLFDNRPYMLCEDILEETTEERNKRLFRYWMEVQKKPETDSDAGKPYSPTSIEQYVSNIDNTFLTNKPDKCLFFTTDIGEVESVIEVLDSDEQKNHTQRSAVRKYLEYLIENDDEEDDDYQDILKHNLWGIHIKNKNNALSDDNPHVCIGWSDMGDLSSLGNDAEITAVYEQCYDDNNRAKGQNIGQIRRFLHEVKKGDYIIFAESSEFHIGKIVSDYYYDNSSNPDQDPDYVNNRKVKWIKTHISRKILSKAMHNSLATAMSIFGINDYRAAVIDLLLDHYKNDDVSNEVESFKLTFETTIDVPYERNRIVFGAPGTGKSFGLNTDCENAIIEYGASFERVTFHPDYSYSQFVGTYKPTMDESGEKIKYEYVPGPFMRVLADALSDASTSNPKPHILIIEEINRAKVAAVFGDVFQLLDRNDVGYSEYEIQASEDIKKYLMKILGGNLSDFNKIRIPNNMYIWATMNSADQGVFPMDTAFKRRWNFEYLGINDNEDEIKGIGKLTLAGMDEPIEWNRLRKAINAKMSSGDFKINEDKLMGPFFLSKKVIASDENGEIIDREKFIDAFMSKVIMYLYEDAVKQGKHRFFDGCPDTSKYSSVCDAFKTMGLAIFGPTFKESFYDKED